ncbi:hypothetical protein GCM10010399_56970 [Dactylosporangium fulvum]|uniref:STAS domain-containing protein n=1 Tax=Dactylosporangium fulvum TaxID=53359 RepID=A0ABY5VSY3_9ACTN|nr:STAS domain-containing protein [Dactylosporangium fulvum]UWP80838.1 STAS domain-containing protein [Dactylosporangium fulvum]
MTELVCFHQPDFPVTVVRPVGLLTYGSVPELRDAVHKALTGHPELVLVDVSELEVLDDITLAAFPMLARQAAEAGIPVMLFGPSPTFARHLATMTIGRQVPVFPCLDDALAAHARRPGPRRVETVLSPVPAATAAARKLVDRSCARWRIRRLQDQAALITTELVANAVEHAGTQLRVSLALRQHYLHIAVRDDSPDLPRRVTAADDLESGRGLLIVEGLASAWGFIKTTDGKVVWATLRLWPGAVA